MPKNKTNYVLREIYSFGQQNFRNTLGTAISELELNDKLPVRYDKIDHLFGLMFQGMIYNKDSVKGKQTTKRTLEQLKEIHADAFRAAIQSLQTKTEKGIKGISNSEQQAIHTKTRDDLDRQFKNVVTNDQFDQYPGIMTNYRKLFEEVRKISKPTRFSNNYECFKNWIIKNIWFPIGFFVIIVLFRDTIIDYLPFIIDIIK